MNERVDVMRGQVGDEPRIRVRTASGVTTYHTAAEIAEAMEERALWEKVVSERCIVFSPTLGKPEWMVGIPLGENGKGPTRLAALRDAVQKLEVKDG